MKQSNVAARLKSAIQQSSKDCVVLVAKEYARYFSTKRNACLHLSREVKQWCEVNNSAFVDMQVAPLAVDNDRCRDNYEPLLRIAACISDTIESEAREASVVVRVGHSKSTSTLRLYPEVTKVAKKPKDITQAKWGALSFKLGNYMRVETMYTATQLKKDGLHLASGWAKPATIMGLVDKRMRDAGLRGVPPQDLAKLKALVTSIPGTKPLQLVGDWMKGKPVKNNGTRTTAQNLVKECGFNLTRPFEQQTLLAHGYAHHFDADKVFQLPLKVRQDKALFNRWWESDKA
jgi:hypothetical protein